MTRAWHPETAHYLIWDVDWDNMVCNWPYLSVFSNKNFTILVTTKWSAEEECDFQIESSDAAASQLTYFLKLRLSEHYLSYELLQFSISFRHGVEECESLTSGMRPVLSYYDPIFFFVFSRILWNGNCLAKGLIISLDVTSIECEYEYKHADKSVRKHFWIRRLIF